MLAISHVRNSAFVRHNAIYFIGSLLTGVLNYLYYPVLGRLMQPAAFGEVQTLVSLFLQISTFLTVLGLLAVNIVATYGDSPKNNRVLMELEKLALGVSLILLLGSVVGGTFLKQYFNFESSLPFMLLALTLVVTVPYTFRASYLRGIQRFGLYSISNAGGSAIKLVVSALLVAIGLSTAGAISGIAFSQLVAFLFVAYYAHKYGFTESLRRHFARKPDFRLILPELKYSLLVLAASLTVTILYSIDIVIVKHYFDSYTAGLYASIATVSRIIFFLTLSISQVLMPSVKLDQSARENSRILQKSLILLVAVGGGTLLLFSLAPHFIVSLLMGEAYVPLAGLLPRLSLAIFIVSALNLFLTYYMALREYASGVIAIIGAAVTIGAMQLSHHSLTAIVNNLLYSSIALTVLLAAWMGLSNRNVIARR
jgi:O-antigen/teichoic acid export membrane protein